MSKAHNPHNDPRGYQQGPHAPQGMQYPPHPQMMPPTPSERPSFETQLVLAVVFQVLAGTSFVVGIFLMVSGNSTDTVIGVSMTGISVPVFLLASILAAICKIGEHMGARR